MGLIQQFPSRGHRGISILHGVGAVLICASAGCSGCRPAANPVAAGRRGAKQMRNAIRALAEPSHGETCTCDTIKSGTSHGCYEVL